MLIIPLSLIFRAPAMLGLQEIRGGLEYYSHVRGSQEWPGMWLAGTAAGREGSIGPGWLELRGVGVADKGVLQGGRAGPDYTVAGLRVPCADCKETPR